MRAYYVLVSGLFLAAPDPGIAAAEAASQAIDWKRTAIEIAYERHLDDVPSECDGASGSESAQSQAVDYLLRIGEESAARDALLVEFPCRSQADEQSSVYILVDENGVASPVFFPVLQVEIHNGESGSEIETILVTERVENREVINAQYDPASRTMEEFDSWGARGTTDTRTRWGFRDGRFQIISFASDKGQHGPRILIERNIW